MTRQSRSARFSVEEQSMRNSILSEVDLAYCTVLTIQYAVRRKFSTTTSTLCLHSIFVSPRSPFFMKVRVFEC